MQHNFFNQLQREQHDLSLIPPLKQRAARLKGAGLSLDLSHHYWNERLDDYFSQWLVDSNLDEQRQRLFAGEKINLSEDRAVLHTALRAPEPQPIIAHMQAQMAEMVAKAQGFTDIVHVGIGGSMLGPELCHQALAEHDNSDLRFHFMSLMDDETLQRQLANLPAKSTLFFIVSKSFKTEETLFITRLVRQWLTEQRGSPALQMFAITGNSELAVAEGFSEQHILPLWPWVGGRFCVWSAAGVTLAIRIGMTAFKEFLHGAYLIDQHFLTAPVAQNMPIQLAYLSAWYTQFWQRQTHAIIPYSSKLQLLPAYLQQLQMESLGKANDALASPVIFGDVGTRSQHALSQYFMQAPGFVPLDMLIVGDLYNESQKRLFAHAKAQSDVLWQGYQAAKGQGYKSIAPYNPHTNLTISHLSPQSLGALLALYEHKVFVLSVMYGINAFDQWGIERGKIIAKQYYDKLID